MLAERHSSRTKGCVDTTVVRATAKASKNVKIHGFWRANRDFDLENLFFSFYGKNHPQIGDFWYVIVDMLFIVHLLVARWYEFKK